MILPPPSHAPPVPDRRHTLTPSGRPFCSSFTRVSATSQVGSFDARMSRSFHTGLRGRCDRILRRAVAPDTYLPHPPSLLIYPTPSQAISCWPSANHAAILSYGLLSLTPLPAGSAGPCRCSALRSVQVRGTACHWLVWSVVDDALLELCEAC